VSFQEGKIFCATKTHKSVYLIIIKYDKKTNTEYNQYLHLKQLSEFLQCLNVKIIIEIIKTLGSTCRKDPLLPPRR